MYAAVVLETPSVYTQAIKGGHICFLGGKLCHTLSNYICISSVLTLNSFYK